LTALYNGTVAIGGNATTTAAGNFSTNGNVTVGGTLTVNGLCVAADTRLRRRRKARVGEEADADEEGYIYDEVMIKDVEEGDEVATLNQKTGEFTWSRVKALIHTGIQPLIKIRTLSGKEIRTTAAHPYLVRTDYPTKAMHKAQKLYRFEVDLSMKIEDFNRDTVVALANEEKSFTVVLPRKVKQALVNKMRRHQRPRKFNAVLYAAAIVEALTRVDARIHELVVDTDYFGQDKIIAGIVRAAFPLIELNFDRVGKKSPAHFAAYGVHIKRKIADYTATLEDMDQNVESALPASSPAHKGAGFESRQALSNRLSLFQRDQFVKTGRWTTVSELKIGQEIAIANIVENREVYC